KHGLDRVDDQDPRLDGVELGLHRAEIGLGPQEQPLAGDAQALGPELHLRGRLLGGHVEHGRRRGGQGASRLVEQGTLADPGITPDENERARHDPATEHAVQLTDSGAQPVRVLHRNVAERTRPTARQTHPAAAGSGRYALLDQRNQVSGHPLAVRARAGLGARKPTLLAPIGAADAGHHFFSGEAAAGSFLLLSPCSPSLRRKYIKIVLRWAPSRMATSRSYRVGSAMRAPSVPSPSLILAVISFRFDTATRRSSTAMRRPPSLESSFTRLPSVPRPPTIRSETSRRL